MLHFIYRWYDPRNQSTKYIGVTNNPNLRIEQHLFHKGYNPMKDAWVQELQELGVKPLVEIVEVVYNGRKAALEREKYWVKHYIEQGCQLLNIRLTSAKKKRPEKGTPTKANKSHKASQKATVETVFLMINKFRSKYGYVERYISNKELQDIFDSSNGDQSLFDACSLRICMDRAAQVNATLPKYSVGRGD